MTPTNFGTLSVRELLRLSAAAHGELRSRAVIRTSNATGDYAEHLFASAFGWSLEANSNAGFDAVHDGIRYQVKSRRVLTHNPSRQLGEFGSFEAQRFDVLAGVIFHDDYSVHRAALVPFDVVRRRSTVVQKRQRFLLRDTI